MSVVFTSADGQEIKRVFSFIDSSAKGSIIGYGGRNIKDISQRTDTRIGIRNIRNGFMDIHITGKDENIDLAFREIMRIVNTKSKSVKRTPTLFKTKILNIPGIFYKKLIKLENWITSKEASEVEEPLRLSFYHVYREKPTTFGKFLSIEIGSINKRWLKNAQEFIAEYINTCNIHTPELITLGHNGHKWTLENVHRIETPRRNTTQGIWGYNTIGNSLTDNDHHISEYWMN